MKNASNLRVLLVIGSNAIGGTELQARLLVDALKGRGVSVEVVLLNGASGMDGLPNDTSLGALGVSWHRDAIRMWRIYRRYRRRLKSGDYDVIHGIHTRGYLATALLARKLPFVNRVAWRRNSGFRLSGRLGYLKSLVERFCFANTDIVIANSDDVADFWSGKFNLDRDHLYTIPNMLPLWRFDEILSDEPLARTRIVAVGGLRTVKGHDVLIRAVALLKEEVEVVVVGEGPERERLEQLASELGVRCQFPGAVADTRAWLSTATVYVHPSRSEGASNAVMEAMAMGLPIIAADVGGMRELLGGTGVLFPAGEAPELAALLERMLESTPLRLASGSRARARAYSEFSQDRVVSATINCYLRETKCVES